MGIFDRFKKTKPPEPAPRTETKPRAPAKTDKELATENNEPYVSIVRMDVDPNNLHQGAFELDWNDIFVAKLVKAGYMIKKSDTDSDIVDRWFQTVCKNIVAENYEQWEVNQPIDARPRQIDRRDLGGGRTEVS